MSLDWIILSALVNFTQRDGLFCSKCFSPSDEGQESDNCSEEVEQQKFLDLRSLGKYFGDIFKRNFHVEYLLDIFRGRQQRVRLLGELKRRRARRRIYLAAVPHFLKRRTSSRTASSMRASTSP